MRQPGRSRRGQPHQLRRVRWSTHRACLSEVLDPLLPHPGVLELRRSIQGSIPRTVQAVEVDGPESQGRHGPHRQRAARVSRPLLSSRQGDRRGQQAPQLLRRRFRTHHLAGMVGHDRASLMKGPSLELLQDLRSDRDRVVRCRLSKRRPIDQHELEERGRSTKTVVDVKPV